MVTRLSGGLTPADGADPRTFPAIWNSTATEIETAQSDITTLQSDVTTAESDIATLQSDVTSAQSDITDRVVKDDSTGAPFLVWGEENASGGIVGENLSLGNGDTTAELVMPVAGKITALGMFLEVSGTTTTLQVVKNGTLAGSGYEISGDQNRQAVTLASPLSFSAGDSINLQFTVGGASACVGSIFGYWI